MPRLLISRWLTTTFVSSCLIQFCLTPDFGRGDSPTLLEWNNGQESEGGPNLDEPIVTDRPDFTEASSTVGRGVVQLETGYTFFSDDNGGASSTIDHSFPEALLRVGMFADWFELRCQWNYLVQQTGGVQSSGPDDLYLGCKLGLTGHSGMFPEMAIIPQMTVPTGANSFTANKVLPGFNWLYGWEINDLIAMGGSTQFNHQIDDFSNESITEWAQSWTFNYSLSERLGAYTEWFGLFPHSADTAKPEYYFDGGFTWKFTPNIQGDARGGVGLNEAATDYFLGLGLSMRYY